MKDNQSDIEKILIKGLIEGNKHSYKLIFDAYYNKLTSYLYKLSNNSVLSEDLVQNVMLRIWENRSSIQITTSLKNYLFRSCYNEFLMHIRKQKKEFDTLDELKWRALFELYTEKNENLQEANWLKLEIAIEKLPNKCKEVFKLSRLEQKKHKEIAEIMGISTKTVEIHITKALRFIKTNVLSLFF